MKHSLRPCANGRNIVGQQRPKVLHVACCFCSAHPIACCCVSLRVVAQPVKPLISYVQTDATTPPGQQCCVRLHWTKTTINNYSYTNNECSGSKIPKISHCFNLHDSSLDRHVNDASCKSLLYDKTTEKPFEIKI